EHTARVVTERDAREHHGDDAGPGLERHSHERGEEPTGHQLQDERAPARDGDGQVRTREPHQRRMTYPGPPGSPGRPASPPAPPAPARGGGSTLPRAGAPLA